VAAILLRIGSGLTTSSATTKEGAHKAAQTTGRQMEAAGRSLENVGKKLKRA